MANYVTNAQMMMGAIRTTLNKVQNEQLFLMEQHGKLSLFRMTCTPTDPGRKNCYLEYINARTGKAWYSYDKEQTVYAVPTITPTDHRIEFPLCYPDGHICSRTQPLRNYVLTGTSQSGLVYEMWKMYCDEGSDIEGLEFELDGVMYEANDVCFHYLFAKGRGDFASDMLFMRMDYTLPHDRAAA